MGSSVHIKGELSRAEITVVVACGVPVIGISFTVRLSLHSQILILKKRYGVTQLKAAAEWRHKGFSREIELFMDIMSTIGCQEGDLRCIGNCKPQSW